MHHLQPGLAGQPDPLGPAGEHRLGADVDEHPADLVAPDLAAGPVGRLEHDDVVPGASEVAGGREAGDPGPDHDDPHK